MQDFKSVIKNKKFDYLWASQILSQVTINIMNFLLLIKLFENTGSTIATSLLWVSYAIPAIIVGPLGAVTVDMFDRKKMLVITNLLQSLVIFLYAFFYEGRLFLLYGITLLYSFLNQFYVPAEAASLPEVVEKDNLVHANGLFFLTQQSALILGFGVAGLLNNFLGFRVSLYICSLLIFIAFLSTTFLPSMKPKDNLSKDLERTFVGFFKKIFEGYVFIRDNRSILLPFLIMLSVQVVFAMVVVNVPLLAKVILGINPNLAGIYIVVPAGIGAVFGTVYVPRLLKKGLRKKTVIEYSFLILSLMLAFLVFIIPNILQPFKLLVSLLLIIFSGACFIGIIIPSQTSLQEATPGGLRGRVFGNFWFLVTVATIIPVIFSGTISEILGIKFLFFLFSAFALLAYFISRNAGQNVLNNHKSETFNMEDK